jgi:hypothetical protein
VNKTIIAAILASSMDRDPDAQPLRPQGLNILVLPNASSRSTIIIWIKAHQSHPIIGWAEPCLLHVAKSKAFVLKICRERALLLLKLKELLGYAGLSGTSLGNCDEESRFGCGALFRRIGRHSIGR